VPTYLSAVTRDDQAVPTADPASARGACGESLCEPMLVVRYRASLAGGYGALTST